MNGVMNFFNKGKLSARCVGSYEIVKWIGNMSYRLDLPLYISSIHLVFHVSMLGSLLVIQV